MITIYKSTHHKTLTTRLGHIPWQFFLQVATIDRRIPILSFELGLIDQDILDDKKAGKVFKEEYETVKRVSTSYGKSFISKYNKNTKFF